MVVEKLTKIEREKRCREEEEGLFLCDFWPLFPPSVVVSH